MSFARVIALDLLGFGRSPKPAVDYGPEVHTAAVVGALDALAVDAPAVLVGHSTGCLVALHLAATHPARVRALVLVAPPIYASPEDARRFIGGLGVVTRLFVTKGPVARASCRWMCHHRRSAARLAPLLRPDLPAPIARDGVEHTWPSYSGTLDRMILAAESEVHLSRVEAPVWILAGSKDRVLDHAHLARPRPGVTFATIEGADHDVPLTHPDQVRARIEAALSRSSPARDG